MKLPNFLIVGAPKAGTTALYHYLAQHPSVFMSQPKEPHFFSYLEDHWPEWATQTDQDYANLFAEADTQTALGEASTWYLYSKTAAQSIQSKIPEMKIIALLRHPVDRAYSSYVFGRQCGWETIPRFSNAIQREPERRQEGCAWDYHYLQAGFYGQQLKRYFETFPKSQIKVLLQQDLKAQPAETMRSVFDFLDIDQTVRIDASQKHNVTLQPKNLTVNNFLVKSNPLKSAIKSLLPASYRQAMVQTIRRINFQRPQTLDSRLRSQLIEHYREDILLLQTLIDRDLSDWLSPVSS